MIHDIKEATERLCHLLGKKPLTNNGVVEINQGRYRIVNFKDESVLLKYTREHFLKFKEDAHGESINVEDLERELRKGIKRVFIAYADEKIYTISPYTIKAQAEIRTTQFEGKETYSFNMNLLIPMSEFKKATES